MLLIQNKGVAPVEAYTLLGYSTARNSTTQGTIGQFGTGAKHGICVLLRAGIDVRIYCGTTRLDFGTREDEVDGNTVTRVTVKIGNRKPKDLDWILDFGAIDWTEVRMALREFVSNAIDQSLQSEAMKIQITDQVKAKDGYTRVFIGEAPEVVEFYGNLGTHFLHFRGDENARIMPKDELSPCKIYRCGVFIRELDAVSICDYNFKAHEIEIDECRNLSDYVARAAIARLYRASEDPADLARVFRSLLNGEKTVESQLDSFYLTWGNATEEQRAVWREAWDRAAGGAIPCPSDKLNQGQFAQRKGYAVVEQPAEAWNSALTHFGITDIDKVLDGSERRGHSVTEPTTAAREAVAKVWEWLEAVSMTNNKPAPTVKGFESIMNGCEDTLGYRIPGESVVYLRNDLEGRILLETALEEVIHHVTGSADGSRDIQDFAFRFITRWLA
jgi:hypothetical protein